MYKTRKIWFLLWSLNVKINSLDRTHSSAAKRHAVHFCRRPNVWRPRVGVSSPCHNRLSGWTRDQQGAVIRWFCIHLTLKNRQISLSAIRYRNRLDPCLAAIVFGITITDYNSPPCAARSSVRLVSDHRIFNPRSSTPQPILNRTGPAPLLFPLANPKSALIANGQQSKTLLSAPCSATTHQLMNPLTRGSRIAPAPISPSLSPSSAQRNVFVSNSSNACFTWAVRPSLTG